MASKPSSSYEAPLFPFPLTNEESFLNGSYSQLLKAQDSLKKYKDFKKVQIKELNEKKKQRIANRSSAINLNKIARRPSKDKDQTSRSLNGPPEASKPSSLPGNSGDLNSQISSIYQANFGTGAPEKGIEDQSNGNEIPKNPALAEKPSQNGAAAAADDSVASSNTAALKELIKSGKFSLAGSSSGAGKPLRKRAAGSLRKRGGGKSTKHGFEQSNAEFNNESDDEMPETFSFMTQVEEEKTYVDVPNFKIKVYLGPNYQEDDVRRIFSGFGEIKWLTMLPIKRDVKTSKSEVCIICYKELEAAISAKTELNGTMHKEFVAKISVTYVKKEHKRKSKFTPKPKNLGFERKKDLVDDPEALGRKIVSYDDSDLFD